MKKKCFHDSKNDSSVPPHPVGFQKVNRHIFHPIWFNLLVNAAKTGYCSCLILSVFASSLCDWCRFNSTLAISSHSSICFEVNFSPIMSINFPNLCPNMNQPRGTVTSRIICHLDANKLNSHALLERCFGLNMELTF